MAKHRGPVLLDNNAIGDVVDLGLWKGLLASYPGQLVTVREIEGEAGTYFRGLSDGVALMASLQQLRVHDVTRAERDAVAARTLGVALDPGERDLWAHALGRQDGWILCGPDKGTLRASVKLGLEARIVSLETLLQDAGLSTKGLELHQTEAWLRRTIGPMIVEERLR